MSLLAAIGIKLAGDYLSNRSENGALDDQKAAAKRGRTRQNELNSRGRKEITDRLDDFDPAKQEGEFNASASKYTDQIINELSKSNENYQETVDGAVGRNKQSYLDLAKYLSDERMKDSSEKASIAGRLNAPNDIRFNDRDAYSDINSEQTYINYLKRLYASTDQTRLNSVRPDKRQAFLGGLLSSAGQAWAGNSLGGGAGLDYATNGTDSFSPTSAGSFDSAGSRLS